MPILNVKTHVHFLMRKAWTIFSSLAYNSTITSNKQRQEHNDLATIWRAKLKGAQEHAKNLYLVVPPRSKPWQ